MSRRLLAPLVAAGMAAALLSACGGGGITVSATFDDVGDLTARHSVQVADVRVGEISGIELTDDFRAEVTMRITDSVQVPERSAAILRTTSLLGEKFIELRPLGDPTAGPFLSDGAVIENTQEAPELEFVAEELITVLTAVNAQDLATIAQTGAEAFGGRGPELRALIEDLATISATFASRTDEIGRIIDGFGSTAESLAAGAPDLDRLLLNLSETTTILAENRQRAITAIDELSRLAAVQNDILGRYREDIGRQIRQADAIVHIVAQQTAEVANLVDWLERFTVALPKVIPGDFTQVYMWLIPAEGGPGSPLCQDPRACQE